MSKAKIIPNEKPTVKAVLRKAPWKSWKEIFADKSMQYWILFVIGFILAIGLALFLCPHHAVEQPKKMPGEAPSYALDADFGEFGGDGEYGQVIAIELGETYSRVAVPYKNNHELICNDEGQLETPNYVAYTENGVLVGLKAQHQALQNPRNTIFDVRRLVGRRFSTDPSLQQYIDQLPYDVVNKDDIPRIKIQIKGKEKLISPEEIQAEVIKRLKHDAEGYLGEKVKNTVITVPTYFNDDQRQATKDAAIIGGLNTLRVINEPTAASIGHDLDRQECSNVDCEDINIVYDLGEKSLDVTLISVDQGVFEILAQAHDRSLGGEVYDRALLDYVVTNFDAEGRNLNLRKALDVVDSMKAQVNKAGETLLTQTSVDIEFGNFSITVTQDHMIGLYKHLFNKSIKYLESVLEESKIEKRKITHILLTGNPNQVAKVQPFLETFFDGKKIMDSTKKLSSDQAVIRGAAHQAQVLSGEEMGCSVGMFDITGLSLGFEIANGVFQRLIPRNSMTPTRKYLNVTTAVDNQSKIVLRIVEGERLMAADNKLFGTLEFGGMEVRKAGKPIVEVVFEIDANMILRVTAREIREFGTGVQGMYQAPVEYFNRYEELDSIVFEAEEHHDEDLMSVKMAEDWEIEDGKESFGVVVVPKKDEPRGWWNRHTTY